MGILLKWLFGILVVDPIILLFTWNVIVVAMFEASRTTFSICLILSIIINLLAEGIKSVNKRLD